MRCCESCGRDTTRWPYCIRCVGKATQVTEARNRPARTVPTERPLDDPAYAELTTAAVYHGETWRDDL